MHPMQLLTRENLSEVWETKGVAEIAAQFGVQKAAIYYWGRKWGLKPKCRNPHGPRHDDPTELEIKQRAREIREAWTDLDRSSRLVGAARKKWTPPVIEVGEIEAPVFSRI